MLGEVQSFVLTITGLQVRLLHSFLTIERQNTSMVCKPASAAVKATGTPSFHSRAPTLMHFTGVMQCCVGLVKKCVKGNRDFLKE